MIQAGFSYFLALERHDKEPISKWDYKQTAEWFTTLGNLSECANVVTFHKINGETIANADD